MPEPPPLADLLSALPSTGHDLPAEPLRRSAMPADAQPHLGHLVTHTAKSGRPLVAVLVKCPKCRRLHRYPWRWDWGIGPEVVSHQEARCPGKSPREPVWVALDPATEAENVAMHRAAHQAYEAWAAERAARKATADLPVKATASSESGT
jgi:hypothetical protein